MSQILIIDDDITVQKLLTRALSNSGYEVTIAKDGLEGIKIAEQIKPNLIICDWLMPKLSGLDVCRKVKQNPQLATTFFILLTSRVAVEDRVEGLDVGADDFICKPIDLQELQARIRAGFRLHQLSEDLKKQKQLLENELNEAAEYVSSILPEPLKQENLQIDFRFIPSRQLGGDIFDYFFLDEDNLVFYLLDVSGHGLKAALPSISVINLLRTQSLSQVDYYQPSSVLSHLNTHFPMTQKNEQFFTIWYGVYNLKNHQLVFSSGGHPPCILVTSDSQTNRQIICKTLKTRSTPIGMFADSKYQDSQITITTPASLFLFSDGLYEIYNQQEIMLDLNSFIDIIAKNNELDKILNVISSYNHASDFRDDLSIMKIDLL